MSSKKNVAQRPLGAPTSSSAFEAINPAINPADGDVGAPREIRPRLRFPEFREAEGWEEKQLGSICVLIRGPFGGNLKKEIFVESGYAVYEQSHAIYEDFTSFRYYIPETKYNELKRFSVDPGDMIMSCSGTMGKFAIVPQGARSGVINQALLKLTVKRNCLPIFLKEVLELPTNQEQLLSQSAGGAIKNVVSVSQIKELKLLIPSLEEQQKIAECLSSVDELIAAQARKLDALKIHKKGLMQQLFPREGETQPRLRFPEFQNAGEWSGESMQDVFVFRQGLQVAVENQFLENEEDRKRFIRIIDITQSNEPPRYIAVTKDANIVSSEDLFMIRYGTPGVVAIGYKGVIANNLFQLIFKKEKRHLPFFWHHYLQTKYEEIAGLSGSSSMPAISFKTLNHVEVKYPTLPEQQRIADCLTTLDDLIAAQTHKHEALKTHKKGLMQQLFPAPTEQAHTSEGQRPGCPSPEEVEA